MASTDPNLHDLTNVYHKPRVIGLPTPPSERKRVRQLDLDCRDNKRPKFDIFRQQESSIDVDHDTDSDDEDEDEGPQIRGRMHQYSIYGLRNRAVMAGPSSMSRHLSMHSDPILKSFVSSNKSDLFKCQSIDERTFITLPYACSYSYAAKHGGTPHLAVATEQGTVHILNTVKRRDWDIEPERVTLQPHENGVFDVKWSPSDTLLATASGDQSVRITNLASSVPTAERTLQILRGHEGTVKCVAWDPSRDGDLVSSGGRDGSICLWDLRVAETRQTSREDSALLPVLSIPKAHETEPKTPKPKGRGRKLMPAAPLKGITNLLYTDHHPYGIISSSSSDGILNLWDLRLPTSNTPKKKSRTTKAPIKPLYTSSADPTMYGGMRRPRGITTLAAGTGPTAGLLYALGTDSRVHTYSVPWLDPLSGYMGPEPGAIDPHAHTHPQMQTNSFYVRLAASPCGRWLASGNAGDGRAYLFDIASAASAARARSAARSGWAGAEAIELRGQTGEVGAMDWVDGMLATCADDGTVRVWRPDVEVSRQCSSNPEEMKWNWSWASAT